MFCLLVISFAKEDGLGNGPELEEAREVVEGRHHQDGQDVKARLHVVPEAKEGHANGDVPERTQLLALGATALPSVVVLLITYLSMVSATVL